MKHIDRTLQSLILTIVILIVFGILQHNFIDFDNYFDNYIPDKFWHDHVFAPSVYDAIILGNSRVYRGVDPETMSSILLNWKIFNFGFSSGGLNPTIYKLAEQKLSPSSEHPTIILGASPTTFFLESSNNEHYQSIIEKSQGNLLLQNLNLDISFEPISIELLVNIIFDSQSTNFQSDTYIYNEPKPNGWIASDMRPPNIDISVDNYKMIFTENEISDDLINAMLSQIEQWVAQGIHVYAFRPPASKQLTTIEDSMSSYNEDRIKELIEEAGGVWIAIDPNDYETYDGNHLVFTSAYDLSRDLANAIRLDLANQN